MSRNSKITAIADFFSLCEFVEFRSDGDSGLGMWVASEEGRRTHS